MDKAHTNKRLGTIIVSSIIGMRLAAAPLLLHTVTRDLATWALCTFLIAVSTDALDGYVARKLGGVTPFLGPYSDAVADFVLSIAAFAAFVVKGLYPAWILLLIAAMFAQFVLTSKRAQPIYDPIGRYYGVLLFCAIGVTLVLPHALVHQAVVVAILGFTFVSMVSRAALLLGFSVKRTLGQMGRWSKGVE
jgi:phosphatidylglycerophosphate synthase